MIERLRTRYLGAVTRVVTVCAQRAVSVLLLALGLSVAAAHYVVTHIALTTDTEGMLDPGLPFKRVQHELNAALPMLSDQIVIVVEGVPAAAEDMADAIAASLDATSGVIDRVYRPGVGAFFQRNGLLFLDTDDLDELAAVLAEAEPFLGTMAADPSLRGLLRMLTRGLEHDLSPEHARLLAPMLDRVSAAVEAQSAGRPVTLSWRDTWLAEARRGAGMARNFLVVTPVLDFTAIRPAAPALALVHDSIRALDPHSRGVRVRVTGDVAMEDEELDNVANDSLFVTALSTAAVLVLLLLAFRSPWVVVGVLLTLIAGLVVSTAFGLAVYGQLNLISVAFAVLFIGMGVDFGIQFGLRFRDELGRRGDVIDALQGTVAGIGGALGFAATVAAVSFFAFAPTSYRGLAELGVIAGVSMIVALGTNLTLLPALLKLTHRFTPEETAPRTPLAGLGRLLVARRGIVLAGTAILILAACVAAPRLHFDFDPINLRDPTTEAVTTFKELLDDPANAPYAIDILEPSLPAARELARRLEQLDVVKHALTLASFVPDAQDDKLQLIADMNLALVTLTAADPTAAPPTTAEEIRAITDLRQQLEHPSLAADPGYTAATARLRRALEGLQASPDGIESAVRALGPRLVGDFPQLLHRLRGLLDAEAVTLESLPPELRARYVAGDGRARVEVFPKENLADPRAMRRFVRQVQRIAPHASGAPVVLVEAGDVVIRSCIEATLLALGGTLLFMIVVLRRPGAILLALLPVVLSLMLTIGASIAIRLPLNFANMITLPLLVGLSNAFGIYMVMRTNEGLDVAGLFRSSTPLAILFSALTSMASFGSLAFARHPGMSKMGLLVCVALALAVFSALIALPALIAEAQARRERRMDAAIR